jgi:hypothetical protein
VVAAELLERALEPGQTLVCDKDFAGREFEQLVVSLRARILRPDRRNEPARFGSLGGVRQWVESAFDTLKDQLSLERHGGRTLAGLVSRVARRLLALAAAQLVDRRPRTEPRRVRPLRNQSSSRETNAGSAGEIVCLVHLGRADCRSARRSGSPRGGR